MTMRFYQYDVGLVTPAQGITDSQLAKLAEQLRIIEYSQSAERIVIHCAAVDLTKPHDLPARIERELAYKAKFKLEPLPAWRPADFIGKAEHLWNVLARRCDEIWCCTAENDGTFSQGRAAALWQLAQERLEDPMHQRLAVRFKHLPGWVSMPEGKPAKAKAKKQPALKGY